MFILKKILFKLLLPLRKHTQLANKILLRLDRQHFLRELGMKIGNNCRIQTLFLPSEAYLISLGNNVHLGDEVQLITHDGAVWVMRHLCSEPSLDLYGPIVIGNNVFIGNSAIILPGVTIGDNVIIGAGAVVTKDITSNSVAAGVPCKTICNTNNYIDRHFKNCLRTKGLAPDRREDIIKKAYPLTNAHKKH